MNINTHPATSQQRPNARRRPLAQTFSVVMAVALLAGSGCSKSHRTDKSSPPSEPIVETVKQNGITLTMTLTPGSVSLDRDILLSIQLTHPGGVSVTLPALADRLQGFLSASSFDREPVIDDNGRITRERVVRLTPLIAKEYRIAPMAVAYNDATGATNLERFFATPPIVMTLNAVMNKPLDDTLHNTLTPIHIAPSLKTVSGYVALLVLLAAGLGLLIFLLGRIKRQIRIMRMSPRERALRELDLLMAKRLVESGRFKDFYIELTQIVRRYIERRHRVRAPEQTTQEFLQAVSADPRFAPAVVNRLRRFLEAADLVKFAAWQPDHSSVENAVTTARDYLSTDSEAADTNGNNGKSVSQVASTAPDKE